MIELTKEDYELSHEKFVKKFRHEATYFKLLFQKKQGYTEPKKIKKTKKAAQEPVKSEES